MGAEDKTPVVQRPDRHVEVKLVTTSGTFPEKGMHKVHSDDLVQCFLDDAAKHLHLVDTSGWIVTTTSGTEINPGMSFAANGLSGTVVIHWGPREGGGGC